MMPDTNVEFLLDGQPLRVPAGTTVAAALALRAPGYSRISVSGEARAPFCGMGICHECRLTVDGRRRLACQTLCSDGLRVETGTGQESMTPTLRHCVSSLPPEGAADRLGSGPAAL